MSSRKCYWVPGVALPLGSSLWSHKLWVPHRWIWAEQSQWPKPRTTDKQHNKISSKLWCHQPICVGHLSKTSDFFLTWDSKNNSWERIISSCNESWFVGSHHFWGAALSTMTNLPHQSVIAQAKYWPSRNSRISHTIGGTKLEIHIVLGHPLSYLHPCMISISQKAITAGITKNADENRPFHLGLQGHSNSTSINFSKPMRMNPKATFDTRGLFPNSLFSLASHCCLLSILNSTWKEKSADEKSERRCTFMKMQTSLMH